MPSTALCEYHDLPAITFLHLNGSPHGLCHRCVRLYKHLVSKLPIGATKQAGFSTEVTKHTPSY